MHIPHSAGNYGPRPGHLTHGCGPNSADRPALPTSNSLTGNTSTYIHSAPPGAFITQTMQGPPVAFPIGAYPGWGSASENMGYPYPGLALPTPVGVRPTISMANPAPTLEPTGLPFIVPAADNAISAAAGKLATGLEIMVWNLTLQGSRFRGQLSTRRLVRRLPRWHLLQLSNHPARLQFPLWRPRSGPPQLQRLRQLQRQPLSAHLSTLSALSENPETLF